MNATEEQMTKIFNKAKIGIMSKMNSVFIATILFSLKHKWEEKLNSADVDGITLRINPDWFTGLSDKARIGLLAHEAWHVAFDHMSRGIAFTDFERFNKAADHVINLMLEAAGYELPTGGLKDPAYRKMSTEQVYRVLPVEPPQDKNGNGSGGYDCDIIQATKENKIEIQNAVADILTKAATQSKIQNDAAGTIPGEVEIALQELLNPKLDWRILLQNYMCGFAKEDYSYRKPNRRYMPEFYLPSLYSENLDEICVAVDTSGSVSDLEFKTFLTEIESIRESLSPAITTIIDFDTSIKHVHKVKREDSIKSVSFSGRGGTDLHPVFEHYKKTKPVVLIVFSDLYCEKIEDKPDYPVIWIAVNNPNASVNFGTLIHYDTPSY